MRASLLKRILSQSTVPVVPTFSFKVSTADISTGSSTATQFKLPLIAAGTYNMVVNWGDGNSDTITVWNAAATTHTYSASGDYTISITGICTGWQFNNTGDRLKFRDVLSWGPLNISTNYAFNGCANLCRVGATTSYITLSATDAPTISVLNATGTFFNCTYFDGNIGNWNMSAVTHLYRFFNGCTKFNNGGSSSINNWVTSAVTQSPECFSACALFNQPIGNWNMSNCTLMFDMFNSAAAFNQDIGLWDVSKVTIMSGMFYAATAFNNGSNTNPINAWNTGLVTSFANMFGGLNTTTSCKFNRDISSWNTANVTDMSNMFKTNTAFNQNIGGWNTVKVTTTANMFQGAIVFNQNLGAWNMAVNANFSTMFYDATAFTNNGSDDINNWVLKSSGTINMGNMFGGVNGTISCKFNRNITSWTTTYVTNMSGMFYFNTSFNQAIGSWDTQNVTTMGGMFYAATAFNQNIGAWNVTKITNFSDMFRWSGSAKLAFNNGGSTDINNWVINSTTSVTMSSMFSGTNFNQPIGNWNVSKVINMFDFLRFNTVFNQDLSSWSLISMTNIQRFLDGGTAFTPTNLDAIYNGWIVYDIPVALNISFGTTKYTAAATEGRALLTRTNTTINVTGTADNGGLIRVTATAHGRSTGNKVFIKSVGGTTNANGLWTVTVVDVDTLELQGSTYNAAWTSGGTVRTGYGWTITDGGI